MNKLMASLLPQSSTMSAVVQEVKEESYVVVSKGISLKVQKAFSCLVMPIVNDKVLLCVEGETMYITAILQRAESSSSIDIVAKDGINIIAEEGNITFNTQASLDAYASKSNIVISEVSFLSNIATIKSHTINSIASIYQGFIDKVTLRHKSLDKIVEGHEEQQSLSSRRIVKGSDIHQVQESITLVKGQMKIDASIMNIG